MSQNRTKHKLQTNLRALKASRRSSSFTYFSNPSVLAVRWRPDPLAPFMLPVSCAAQSQRLGLTKGRLKRGWGLLCCGPCNSLHCIAVELCRSIAVPIRGCELRLSRLPREPTPPALPPSSHHNFIACNLTLLSVSVCVRMQACMEEVTGQPVDPGD